MTNRLFGSKHEELDSLEKHDYFNRRVSKAAQVCNRFPNGVPFEGATTLDIGCGYGALSFYAATAGAREVVGVDPDPKSIKTARETLPSQAATDSNKIVTILGGVEVLEPESFDLAISMAVFEHIPDPESELKLLFKAMKPGGLVYLAIGPLYMAPWGDHRRMKAPLQSIFPWAHLCFPQKWLLKRLNRHKVNRIEFRDLPDLGLNGWKLKDYKRAFEESGFTIEWLKTNVYEVSIVSKVLNFLCKAPFLRDFFCVNVYVILEKPRHPTPIP